MRVVNLDSNSSTVTKKVIKKKFTMKRLISYDIYIFFTKS